MDQETHEQKPTIEERLIAALEVSNEKRDAAILERVDAKLDALSKPIRTDVEKITDADTGERTVVSRSQPTDPLYARLYRRFPEVKAWRSADQDGLAREWLLCLAGKGERHISEVADKLADVNARATTLEGAIDASDPTAVLGGTGGHLLPQNVNAIVNIARDKIAVLPGIVMPLDLASGTLRVPTAGAATAAMVAEGSTAAQGEPTFASDMLKAQKCQCFMKASVELIADSAFNVMSIYAQRAGAAIAALEDVQIATSNGTAPNISEALSGGNVAEATSTVLIYEDLVTLYFAPAQVYRNMPSTAWAANDVTLQLLSKLMDGNDHPVLSLPGAVAPVTNSPGAAGSVFGKPVYEAPFANGELIFGDFASYGFARRETIRAEASTHADFASDLVQFKFTERFDGRILDDVGLKEMSGLATVA